MDGETLLYQASNISKSRDQENARQTVTSIKREFKKKKTSRLSKLVGRVSGGRAVTHLLQAYTLSNFLFSSIVVHVFSVIG